MSTPASALRRFVKLSQLRGVDFGRHRPFDDRQLATPIACHGQFNLQPLGSHFRFEAIPIPKSGNLISKFHIARYSQISKCPLQNLPAFPRKSPKFRRSFIKIDSQSRSGVGDRSVRQTFWKLYFMLKIRAFQCLPTIFLYYCNPTIVRNPIFYGLSEAAITAPPPPSTRKRVRTGRKR